MGGLIVGNGEVSVSESGGKFEIWINREGTGDEGGSTDLHWVDGASGAQMSALAKAIIDMVGGRRIAPNACIEAGLLHQVVMAVIAAGQGDILKGIDELNEYYDSKLPTVAEVIGSRPAHAIITGDISFDDKVYSFKCARMVK